MSDSAEPNLNEYKSLDGGDVLELFFPHGMDVYKSLLLQSCNTLIFASVSL